MGLDIRQNSHLAERTAPWLMFSAVCIWGLSFVVTKATLNDDIPPMLLTTISYLYGAAGSIPILIWKRRELFKKGVIKEGAVLGAVLFCARFLQVIGCSFSTAGKNAFITAVYVVLVPIFMCLLMKQRLELKSIGTAVMTLAGIGLVAVNEQMSGFNTGDLITFVSSIGFAVHIVYTGKFTRRHDPWVLGGLQLIFAAVFSTAAALAASTPVVPAFYTLKFQVGMLYIGVLGMTIGFAFQSVGQKYVAQNKAAMILSLESVSGALFSAAILKEQFGVKTIVGCAIIFVAILLSTYKPKQQKCCGEDSIKT